MTREQRKSLRKRSRRSSVNQNMAVKKMKKLELEHTVTKNTLNNNNNHNNNKKNKEHNEPIQYN